MVNLLDKHGPATAVEPGGVWLGGLRRWRAVGGLGNPLGADASGLVGVVAVIADEVLALVGDVLGEFGEEIERAMGYGLEVLKFFPAGAFGGPATLKAVSAPYRQVRFIPTGGVSLENVASYLSLGCVLACGGSWLAKREVIDAGRFEEITETVRKSLAVISDL